MTALACHPGMRIGMLTALGKLRHRGNGQLWLWKCDCGNKYVRELHLLRQRERVYGEVSCSCRSRRRFWNYQAEKHRRNRKEVIRLMWEYSGSLYNFDDKRPARSLWWDFYNFDLCPGDEPDFESSIMNESRFRDPGDALVDKLRMQALSEAV